MVVDVTCDIWHLDDDDDGGGDVLVCALKG